MQTHTIRSSATAIVVFACLLFGATSRADTPSLSGGADSKEALVRMLLDALEKNDPDALHALRVDEREYLQTILPGTVPPGQSLRAWPDYATRYFWGEIDSKCRYLEEDMLQRWHGHHWELKSMTFERGQQDYATYRAFKQTRLTLTGEDGKEAKLEIGSIAEIGGRYKFISFKRD